MTDYEFVKQALRGDNSEVQLGRLALKNAGSASVKSFAQMLIDDHSKARLQAAAVAEELKAPASNEVAPDAQKTYDHLQTLKGADFDRQFVAYMVQDHEKDIADFKQEASQGHGPAQKLAAEGLPTLEKHLETAKSLEHSL
jgi:putative membrane protein